MMARVNKNVKDNEGKTRGIEQPKLFANHSLYEVKFLNGRREEHITNVIAENVLSQVY